MKFNNLTLYQIFYINNRFYFDMEYPCEKIRDIESSLDKVASKIKILSKERQRDLDRIDKVLEMAIPKIKNRMNDTAFQEKKNKKTSSDCQIQKQQIQQNKDRKKSLEMRITRSREILVEAKAESYKQMKELSKLNAQKIQRMKLKAIENKRKRKEQVQEKFQNSKNTIENFHQQKKNNLKRKKELELQNAEKRIHQLAKNINSLYTQKDQIMKKRNKLTSDIDKFKKTITKLHHMRLSDFSSTSKRVGINEDLSLEDVSKFLNTVNKENNIVDDYKIRILTEQKSG